ncbi:UNVERIFIED_CONTAM: hypothetical protein K2H54_032421 [Gekko kuhli]
MISRRDTQRAVEILARYQGILRSPEEQPLHESIGKVVHVFQSELFQALLDIQECYELSLFSASKQDGTPTLGPCTSWNQHYAGTKGSLDDQSHHKLALQVRGWASPGITLGFPHPTPKLCWKWSFCSLEKQHADHLPV